MPRLTELFGRRLRQLRRASGLSQEELAERISRSTEFISNLERGINGPSLDTIEKLAQAFQIEAKELFNFDETDEADF